MKNKPFSSSENVPLTRRDFLKAAGAAALLPGNAWARAISGVGRPSASNRITLGVIGWGMMGPAIPRHSSPRLIARWSQLAISTRATCRRAVDTVNTHYGNKDCKAYHDYRELLARDDIDAVMIAVPDQWHALLATEAANRKKDIYGEKPLARTVAEQQAIVSAVQKNNIIWQTGSWQRSLPQFHKAAEIVRNGLIGNVMRVEVGLPGGHHDFPGTVPALMQKLSSLPDKIASPADIVPGTPHGILPSLSHRLSWTMTAGLALRKLNPTSRLASTRIGAGITTPAAASCWTGSATTATSRIGAWASTSLDPPKLKATASFPRKMPCGTRQRNT